MRGGTWNNESRNARSAYRNERQRDNRNDNLGFRLALSSTVQQARSGRAPWTRSRVLPVPQAALANRKAPGGWVGRVEARRRQPFGPPTSGWRAHEHARACLLPHARPALAARATTPASGFSARLGLRMG